MSCVVCNAEGSKYKCPGCSARYCGVPCFASHKAACAPHRVVVTPLVPSLGLERTTKKRPYESEREELSFTASSEVLDRVLATPEAQAIVSLLNRRLKDAAVKREKKTNDGPGDEPEEMSTKVTEKGAVFRSVEAADASAGMNRMADMVVKVCSASALRLKRELLLQFCAEEADCDAFCNTILEAMGVRKDGEKD
jgi:hypothetical protein